jgi:hypothetical protein
MRQCLKRSNVTNWSDGRRMGKLTTRRGILGTSGGLLLGGLLLVLRPMPAQCDDLLVMPYACSIVGGHALLTPSQNQGHRIIGPREQRSFRACSPVNPALCREWTVHRFDMDCDGVALPWAAVAASARPERGSYENGRLQLRMPPHWTLAADDPCASGERWRYGRLQRYCADRRALSAAATVAMPPGFAPLLGIDAIFVTPSSARNTSAAAAHSPQLPATPFAASVTRSEPSQAAAPKPSENEPPPAKQSAAVHEAQPAVPTPAALAAPVVPKIINRPGAVAEPAPSLPPAAVAEPAPSLPPAVVAEAGSQVGDAPAVTLAPITSAATHHVPAHTSMAVLAAVLVALTALVLGFLGTRRRRLRPNRAAAPPSLAVRGNRKVVRTQEGVAHAPATSVWSTVAASSPTWNEEVPRTRLDALRVLGMGVAPDANLAAIKKIVDGLRQTWHPDLAHDNSDREVREKRMKQINVAWDILAAKPART